MPPTTQLRQIVVGLSPVVLLEPVSLPELLEPLLLLSLVLSTGISTSQ